MWSSNLWALGEGMLGPFVAVFTNKIGGDILDISWAWTIYLFAGGLLTMILGKMSDTRFRKEWLLVLGYLLNTVFTFGYLFVDSPLKLFIIEAGFGIASAMVDPTWNALYARYMNKERSGETWGTYNGLSQMMGAFSLIIGGAIITYTNFEVLFILMGTVQLFATIYQTTLLKEALKYEKEKEEKEMLLEQSLIGTSPIVTAQMVTPQIVITQVATSPIITTQAPEAVQSI
jgi:MFS family permease